MKSKDIMHTTPDLFRISDTFEYLIRILNRVKYFGGCAFQ